MKFWLNGNGMSLSSYLKQLAGDDIKVSPHALRIGGRIWYFSKEFGQAIRGFSENLVVPRGFSPILLSKPRRCIEETSTVLCAVNQLGCNKLKQKRPLLTFWCIIDIYHERNTSQKELDELRTRAGFRGNRDGFFKVGGAAERTGTQRVYLLYQLVLHIWKGISERETIFPSISHKSHSLENENHES